MLNGNYKRALYHSLPGHVPVTMAPLLGARGLPRGPCAAVKRAGDVPSDLFAEMSCAVLAYVRGESLAVDTGAMYERLISCGVEGIGEQSVQEVVSLLTGVFRVATQAGTSGEQLALDLAGASSEWTRPALKVIKHVWDNAGPVPATQWPASLPSAARLLDVRWKVGISVSSDRCRALNAPFVTLCLALAEKSGRMSTRVFEMNLTQFQNFSRQLKEMSSAMDTA
ncbi:COMM domain-containing protein 6 [Petromyzon marinus]|uniref:COMM domain-containing protein 6 n=1 Tax=Petromyzon marinus TaxID=7757 RepID=A0AAJ7T7C8_PETMA|nr:COMM domain-containing protein 6 [Petromyzon marinus]